MESKNEALPTMINGGYIDRFTIAHAIGGVIAANLKVTPIQAIILAVGWEIAEDVFKQRSPSLFPHPSLDSKQNALIDVGTFLVAYALTKENADSKR